MSGIDVEPDAVLGLTGESAAADASKGRGGENDVWRLKPLACGSIECLLAAFSAADRPPPPEDVAGAFAPKRLNAP